MLTSQFFADHNGPSAVLAAGRPRTEERAVGRFEGRA